MEKIAWRAVLAVSIGGMIIGGLLFFFGYRGHGQYNDEWVAASNQNAAKLETCKGNATDRASQSACFEAWSNDETGDAWMMTAGKNSGDSMVLGVKLGALMPISLFSLYFLLRWIFTGRWKDAKAITPA